jgi:single-strand DNA-binding protein
MLNKVILQGRLTETPELKQTTNGVNVCGFSIAVERNAKSADGHRQTDFINCVAWRNTAKFICDYFVKGKMIVIAGELQTRAYEDKNGNKRTAVEVIASEANFCGDSRAAEFKEPTAEPVQEAAPTFVEVDADELPF